MDRPSLPGFPLFVIAGPTASGKTAIAAEVARALGAELVGADSMQIYRGLDIGTAKPTAAELRGVPHHLIDIADPDEPFDAARYVMEADRVIAGIAARKRRAIVVGGTGLYIRSLLHGLHAGPPPDPSIRTALLARAEQEGWPALHRELEAADPETGGRLHPNDGVRILRALEVLRATGVPMARWQQSHGFAEARYAACVVGIERPRSELDQRIDERVDRMVATGWVAEVAALLERGYHADLKPLQGLGYRRICEHLLGELSLAEAVAKAKTDTRRFAKRQTTWFRREPGLRWTEPDAERVTALAREHFQA